ncbi:MAG: HAD hydrolase-like protein [Deltaproteobacteria bacterium]|nr:HAD hydrolase-like protein [Deltaproteobacteria bacterium]
MNPATEKLAFVFDWDGTLVDSMGKFAEIASGVIARHFGRSRAWGKARYLETSGLPFPFQLERIFPGDERNQKAVADYDHLKIESYDSAPFFSDVKPALEWLSGKGVGLAISSNNDYPLLEKKLGALAPLFDCVAGFEPGFLKGKSHFDWIRGRLKGHRLIFVGDSLHDAAMAGGNGIPFYARTGTFTEDDFKLQGIASGCISTLFDLEKVHANSSFGRGDGDASRAASSSAP